MTSNYEIQVRNQYTFVSTPRDLAVILTQNVALYAINIIGLCIIHTSEDVLLVKMVVGNGTDRLTDLEQNENFRLILQGNNICFSEQDILQITNVVNDSEVSGQFRIVYTALICSNIPILALYLGQPYKYNVINTFVEVPSDKMKLARKIITDISLAAPDESLCINLRNCVKKPLPTRSYKFACISDNR